ncbi:MAG: glucokinase [Nitrospiraceae bacterium]
MILAGDIGGTKTVLALFQEAGGGLRQLRDETFPSRRHRSLENILAKFLKGERRLPLRGACFGAAGPVINGRCRTTNLPWSLDESHLARAIGVPRVKLLNDLEAAAFGMLYLGPDELSVLNPGGREKHQGNIAVIAAGTGLGEAMLYWDGAQHHPIASEGGHVDFAPRTDQEMELLRYLGGMIGGRVSYERVLSGPGLYSIYRFLRDSGHAPEPPWLTEKLKSGDPSATVSQLGVAGKDPLCVSTLDLFCSLYGAEAGNLALKCMAVGGVFVGGGIAPKVLPALRKGSFMQSFTDKGRFSELLKSIEVSVALNPRAPLVGAAHFALRFC